MKNRLTIAAREPKNWLSLLIFTAMALLAAGSADSEEKTQRVKSSEALVTISAVQLYGQYETNEVEADNRYKGKVVTVTGEIENIGKDLTDEAYVSLGTGNILFSVQCFFGESEEHSFTSLRKGQQLTIKGRCDGKFGNVFLQDCSFQ
ncbi:MAG: hypothetical protein JHC85_09860 [Chthoniobacterales bacterium]|nr:hypothetical protein [Chthoniobacterales bacterium]